VRGFSNIRNDIRSPRQRFRALGGIIRRAVGSSVYREHLHLLGYVRAQDRLQSLRFLAAGIEPRLVIHRQQDHWHAHVTEDQRAGTCCVSVRDPHGTPRGESGHWEDHFDLH
jgi:hypothetical protein